MNVWLWLCVKTTRLTSPYLDENAVFGGLLELLRLQNPKTYQLEMKVIARKVSLPPDAASGCYCLHSRPGTEWKIIIC